MLPEVDLFYEWCVANFQNAVEWVPLASDDWPKGFVNGTLRQGRLRQLVAMAHTYGLEAGCDVPIALRRPCNCRAPTADSRAQLLARISRERGYTFDFRDLAAS